MKNNRVGIAGYWFATNYGGVASYYSLYKKIEQLSFKPKLIEDQYYYISPEGTDVFSRNFFKEEGFDITKCYTNDKLQGLNELADKFVVGSDQVFTSHTMKSWGQVFLLGFAEKNKTKIAYSSSCGGDTFEKLDPELKKEYKKKLQDFNHISIRELNGVDLMKKHFEVETTFKIDPIYFTTPETYTEIGTSSGIEHKEKFIFAYILDPTEDKKECILKLAKELNMPVKIALDGRKNTHDKNATKMNMPDCVLPELNFREWLSYYTNASYVFTDSFHGASMSLILNKPFVIYANYERGYPRFVTLCKLFNIDKRMIEKFSELKTSLIKEDIDFKFINNKIKEYTTEGSNWLKDALESDADTYSTKYIYKDKAVTSKLNQNMCTGCSACVNICPFGALSITQDELGYYRSTIDENKCTNCGLCAKICPALANHDNGNSDNPSLYEFIAKDKDVVFKSTSGGVFSMLAEEVFKQNGYVCGAAWADDFSVHHIMIDNKKDLDKLRKSKYLQSYIGNIFTEVKKKLDENKLVLFSGCPCQIAGLKSYLQKDYENLILVDILCGSAPSSMFFKKYINDDFKNKKIKSYEFRSKDSGWNCESITITTKLGFKIKRRGKTQDNYQRVYHEHVMCSEHCEKCKYQNAPRFGDLTIGDFWDVGNKDKSIDCSQGVSAVLVNNAKGKAFFDKIPAENIAVKKEVPWSWLGGNGYSQKGAKNFVSPKRNDFYKAIQTKSFSEAVNYALKPNHGELVHRFNRERLPALCYDVKCLHFKFDPSYWEEHFVNGATTLFVKVPNPKPGHYATLPLNGCLKEGVPYILSIKFKVNTNCEILNLHIKDSGSNAYQVIHTHKVAGTNNQWVEFQKEFTPIQGFYDEFMIGAGQIFGSNSYLSIGYINILEKE